MKSKILLLAILISCFSCSKDDIQSDSEVTNENLKLSGVSGVTLITPKILFMNTNKHRSFILVCNSQGQIVNYKYYDKGGEITPTTKAATPITSPDASCSPFQAADNSFVHVVAPNLWKTFNHTTYFNVGFWPNNAWYPNSSYIADNLTNIYHNLNNYSLLPVAPGSVWTETDYFEVIYHESPTFNIDMTHGDYYDYPNLGASINTLDFISTSEATYLRDEIACQVISTYYNNYSSYTIGGATVHGDTTLCDVNPSDCDSRWLSTRVSIGNWTLP